MALLDKLIPKATAAYRTIVLPEGQDVRVIEAAHKIATMKMAKVVVLATPEEAAESTKGYDFTGLDVEIMDWTKSDKQDEFAAIYQEMRAKKGMTIEGAREAMQHRLYFGNMLLRQGIVDGLVAGSIASTGDMVRSAFQVVGTAPGIKVGSSCFVMDLATPSPAGDDCLIYADCGVNPNPNAEQLVDIAIATATTHNALIGTQPKMGFLSFSTYGSAKHELVDKMQVATKLCKERVESEGLDIIVDGELQADAAIVPKVAASKCPDSPLKGESNILIFPDLQAGNICYKITERLAGAAAYGPILQGLAKPINDLSRGCCADDIVGVVAITICQSLV